MSTGSEAPATPLADGSIEVVVGGRRLAFPPGKSVRLGRSADVEVVIEDPTVGRHHATLEYGPGGWSLIDAGSQNGTWLDGRRVGRLDITDTVTLHLGATDAGTQVTITAAAAPSAAPPATAASPVSAGGSHDTILVRRGSDATQLVEPPQAWAGGGGGAPARAGIGGAAQLSTAGGDQPVLVVRTGGTQLLFPVGAPVRIGRDPTLEVVSTNPLVSRQHGVLTSDSAGATYTDSSARGTYLNGRRLTKPLRITESITLHLGDPSTGEELGVTPPLSITQIEHNRRRRMTARRVKFLAAAGVAVIALVVGGIELVGGRQSSNHAPSPSAGLPAAALARAEAATVRLLAGTPTDATSSGSGTIISADGLILTNGHVAQPQAVGSAVAQSVPGRQLDANPPFLTVELTSTSSVTVVARYRARPVVVDGYLDLALIQIDSDATGRPVERSSLHLPFLRLGDVSKVQLAQPVTVLGFPGVSQSESLSVTSGVISTFIPDPLKHNPDPRFELETTARVAHGNSGGAAIDNTGDLIGVPSLAVPGQGSDVSWRLRPVSLVKPLLAVAQSGGGATYKTPWLVAATGREQARIAGWSAQAQGACGGSSQVPSGAPTIAVGFNVTSIPTGLDLAVIALLPTGQIYRTLSLELPQTAYKGGNCVVFGLFAQELARRIFPDGIYRVQLLGGPDLHVISDPVTAVVGAGP